MGNEDLMTPAVLAAAAAAGAAAAVLCTKGSLGASTGSGAPASPPGSPVATTAATAQHPAAAQYSYLCEPYTGQKVVKGDTTKNTPRGRTGRQARVVHFIRHAQGTHNIAVATEGEAAYANWKYRDARLTEVGREQARGAAPTAAKMRFDTVLVSPLSRTLQTADLVLPPSCKSKMVACELVRERIGLNPCDLRREKHELQGEFPEMDFSQLPTETDPYWSTERESLPALQQRVNSFLAYLFESDTCSCDFVGAVTHNDFLTMLLYDSALAMASSMPEFRKFKNCEIQSYVVSRTTLSPCLDEASLSAEQRKRYPKSTGNVPKVQ